MRFWHEDAFIYHIYPLGACGAPPSFDKGGANRLPALERWIPHIKDMGCDAVLFCPVFESRSHGYDTTDYFRIDRRLGDNDGFRALVTALHGAGLRVVLDGVFNHCGRDFFAFRDVKEKRAASPYAAWFSGIDFSRDNAHHDGFSYDTWNGYEELVKFNLGSETSPACSEAMEYLLGAAEFWIKHFGIDGLRLDAANSLSFGFMRDLRRRTEALRPDFWLMGEVVAGDYAKWVNADTLHSVTNYVLYKGLYSSHNDENLFELAYTLTKQFGPSGPCLPLNSFLENHDQNRLASLVKRREYLYTLYILLFTVPGVPSLYYGGEWGVRGEKKDGSDAALRPYIDPTNAPVEEPALAPVIKKLAAIRKASEALRHGDYAQLSVKYRKPLVFERRHASESVVVAVNPYAAPAEVTLPGLSGSFFDMLNDEAVALDGRLSVPPYWGRVLRRERG
jgi:glycosidase